MNNKAVAAKNDPRLRENFIHDNEQTILRIASKCSNKYITRSDDEWSVALLAFNRSIDTYSEESGDFLPYCSTVIKRALIDHYRSERRHEPEMPVSSDMLTGDGDYESNPELLGAIYRGSTEDADKAGRAADLRSEIIEVNEQLIKYGFTFRDLKDASPKAGKTKTACARAVSFILDNDDMLENVVEYRRLPIKEISAGTGVGRKILDRHRRYIIMAVIILNGEYPLLADYLMYIKFTGKEGSG